MTPDAAAWVREHVWTGAMRKTFREVPGFYLTCACQWGNGPCRPSSGLPRHDACHLGTPIWDYETIIGTKGGIGVTAFAEPYRHPTASATGWHRSHLAMVWLADRACRWACPCNCGHPYVPAHALKNNPMRPVRYEAVPLPGLDLAGIGA